MSVPLAERSVEKVLSDPDASSWLKTALRDSLERDPVEALNDALLLASMLEERLRHAFDLF